MLLISFFLSNSFLKCCWVQGFAGTLFDSSSFTRATTRQFGSDYVDGDNHNEEEGLVVTNTPSRSFDYDVSTLYANGETGEEGDNDDDYINNGKEEGDDEGTKQITFEDSLSLQNQIENLNHRLDQQQTQIDRLLDVIKQQVSLSQQQQSGEGSAVSEGNAIHPTAAAPVVPVKAMLFIDGTWLYYSLYGREASRCRIIQKYGYGWYQNYRLAWDQLPHIICRSLRDRGWSSGEVSKRPMEIVRACVFTSYKADTLQTSLRYQLFEELKANNYDVQQMETVGKSEKCVDIQLAVEMLHYATVSDAYDVAIVLTGDKDFLPALVRTRQKGRKVALVSMRSGCNRALREVNGIKDYDVVWLEDHLDELLVPKSPDKQPIQNPSIISVLTVAKVLKDFIEFSGYDVVNSRDVGRYFQNLNIGSESLLTKVRTSFGGLGSFVAQSPLFEAVDRSNSEGDDKEQSFAYWIKLLPDAQGLVVAESQNTAFSQEERSFFEAYETKLLEDRQTTYYHTLQDQGESMKPEKLPTVDYSTFTVAQLKERCRERGLITTGLKAVLLERVLEDEQKEKEIREKEQSVDRPPGLSKPLQEALMQRVAKIPAAVADYLKNCVEEYLRASGGDASSRDIGRYLTIYKSSEGQAPPKNSALKELKVRYGGLSSFVNAYPDVFARDDEALDDHRAFLVKLVDRSRNQR